MQLRVISYISLYASYVSYQHAYSVVYALKKCYLCYDLTQKTGSEDTNMTSKFEVYIFLLHVERGRLALSYNPHLGFLTHLFTPQETL